MINVALFGNPNVGKTTVFNLLTGLNQYVGNWPGVTIEKKEGYLNDNIKIVDLPGIYAMDTFSNEEKVSKSYLENEDVDVIVNVVDASNLDRNLYLTTQLMKYNKPIILLLNMIDLADAKGIKTDYDKLAKELDVTILPIIAKKKSGLENIAKVIEDCSKQRVNYSIDFGDQTSTYKKLEEIIDWSKDLLVDGGRLVANFIIIDTFYEMLRLVKEKGFKNIDVTVLNVAKLEKLGTGEYFKPHNPIYIISCEKGVEEDNEY